VRAGAPSAQGIAVDITSSAGIVIADNFLHTGTSGAQGGAAGVQSTASPGAKILHNTIIVGAQAGYGFNIFSGGASQKDSFANVVIANNLVVGDGSTTRALHMDQCAADGLSIRGNVFADLSTTVSPIATITCDHTANEQHALSDLGPAFGTGDFSGNRELAASCGSDRTLCTACSASGTGTCGPLLFQEYDTVSFGLDGFRDRLLQLRSDAKCAWTDDGEVLTDVPTDAFGTTRTAPVSAGAHEGSTCVP